MNFVRHWHGLIAWDIGHYNNKAISLFFFCWKKICVIIKIRNHSTKCLSWCMSLELESNVIHNKSLYTFQQLFLHLRICSFSLRGETITSPARVSSKFLSHLKSFKGVLFIWEQESSGHDSGPIAPVVCPVSSTESQTCCTDLSAPEGLRRHQSINCLH